MPERYPLPAAAFIFSVLASLSLLSSLLALFFSPFFFFYLFA